MNQCGFTGDTNTHAEPNRPTALLTNLVHSHEIQIHMLNRLLDTQIIIQIQIIILRNATLTHSSDHSLLDDFKF